jgi:hypothetical protein
MVNEQLTWNRDRMLWFRLARDQQSGYRFCVRSRANVLNFAHDLVGEPGPTSPDHAQGE